MEAWTAGIIFVGDAWPMIMGMMIGCYGFEHIHTLC
jgi:hypothetical protein